MYLGCLVVSKTTPPVLWKIVSIASQPSCPFALPGIYWESPWYANNIISHTPSQQVRSPTSLLVSQSLKLQLACLKSPTSPLQVLVSPSLTKFLATARFQFANEEKLAELAEGIVPECIVKRERNSR